MVGEAAGGEVGGHLERNDFIVAVQRRRGEQKKKAAI